MQHSKLFHEALERLDVGLARRVWSEAMPNMPQPESGDEVLATMHLARTAMRSMPLKIRAYSHRWCVERGLPSQLPDELRPVAERMYPRIVEAVGVSCTDSGSGIAPFLQRVMVDRVEDIYSTDRLNFSPDPDWVRSSILDARRERKKKIRDLLSTGRL